MSYNEPEITNRMEFEKFIEFNLIELFAMIDNFKKLKLKYYEIQPDIEIHKFWRDQNS